MLALALTHVLQLTGMLQWWTRQTVEVENNMTSVERMVEYMRLPQEPPRCACCCSMAWSSARHAQTTAAMQPSAVYGLSHSCDWQLLAAIKAPPMCTHASNGPTCLLPVHAG